MADEQRAQEELRPQGGGGPAPKPPAGPVANEPDLPSASRPDAPAVDERKTPTPQRAEPNTPAPGARGLRLTATVAGKDPVLAPGSVTIEAGGSIRFAVVASEEVSVPTLFAGEGTPLTATLTNAAKAEKATEWTGDVEFQTIPDKAVYAQVTVRGEKLTSDAIRIEAATPSSESTPDAAVPPAEVQVGEYDPEYAKLTGTTFRTLAFVISGLAAFMLLWVMPVGGGGEVPFVQRVIAAASIVTLAVGSLSVLTGVWLATLEARGRQRARLNLSKSGARGGLATDIPFDEVTKLAKELGKARGTVIAVSVGVLLIVIGMLGVTGSVFTGLVPANGTSQTGGDDGQSEDGDK